MSEEALIELKPLGINLSGPHSRPLLLLKDLAGDMTMPVPISHLEAGILLQQTGQGPTMSSPHNVTQQILTFAHLQIERCIIHAIKNTLLMSQLEIKSEVDAKLNLLEIKAESAVALCLYLNVPIYSSREMIWKARSQSLELQESESQLHVFQTSAMRPHQYLM